MHRGMFTSAVLGNSTCSYVDTAGRSLWCCLASGNFTSLVDVEKFPDRNCFIRRANKRWPIFCSTVAPIRFSRIGR